MNDLPGKTDSDANEVAADEEGIATLIKIAGERRPVPEQRFDRARSRVHAHWQGVVDEQSNQARGSFGQRYLAIAATVVLGISVMLFWRMAQVDTAIALATVENLQGQVLVDGKPLRIGSGINAGAFLETAPDSRLALRLSAGQSLRLNSASRLQLHSDSEVSLQAGAVYFDILPGSGAGSVNVRTPFGVARDIGTQFQVILVDDSLTVGVREGLVELIPTGQQLVNVRAGEFLQLSDNGSEGPQQVSNGDSRWDWVESIAPEFELDGSTLAEFLAWFARENGLELQFADAASQSGAQGSILSGDISGMSLDAAMDAVKRTNRFDYQIENNMLTVSLP